MLCVPSRSSVERPPRYFDHLPWAVSVIKSRISHKSHITRAAYHQTKLLSASHTLSKWSFPQENEETLHSRRWCLHFGRNLSPTFVLLSHRGHQIWKASVAKPENSLPLDCCNSTNTCFSYSSRGLRATSDEMGRRLTLWCPVKLIIVRNRSDWLFHAWGGTMQRLVPELENNNAKTWRLSSTIASYWGATPLNSKVATPRVRNIRRNQESNETHKSKQQAYSTYLPSNAHFSAYTRKHNSHRPVARSRTKWSCTRSYEHSWSNLLISRIAPDGMVKPRVNK